MLFQNNPILAKWVSEGLTAHEENIKSFREDPMNVGLIGSTAHEGLMYVTPEKYEDDVNAFLYYGSMGLFDPKNPTVDAPTTARATGWSYGKSLGFTLIGGFVVWGTLGWIVDPADRREGGLAEREEYQKSIGHTHDFHINWGGGSVFN
jgi:hypothetical protein